MKRGRNRRRIFVIVFNYKMLYLGVIFIGLGIATVLLREPFIGTIGIPGGMVSGKKVVIDPGHGGSDPGAKSPGGLEEKDLNLDVALKLKKYFARVGVYCVMVREHDCDFSGHGGGASTKKVRDLVYRTNLANQSRADLFLSIHANSFPDSYYRGAQTFFNPVRPASKLLAEAIQNQLVKRLGPNRRRARPGDFRVLNETQMPGATIEIGFLSNPAETALLSDPAYRERIAEAIFNGVLDFWLNRTSDQETKP